MKHIIKQTPTWYWDKNRHVNQPKGTENLKRNSGTYGILIFNKEVKNIQWGKYSFQQPGKLEKHMQNNDIDSYPTIPREINSKWIKDLSIRSDTMKPLEENVG